MTEAEDSEQTEATAEIANHLQLRHQSEEMARALLARPRLSLRMQLLLGFLVVFLFALGLAAVIILSFYEVEKKTKFLEIVSDYVFEIDRARRFEKNYFLYNTDLEQARRSVSKAKSILAEHREQVRRIVGRQQWRGVITNIEQYERLLDELSVLDRSGRLDAEQKKRHERKVRRRGHEMVLLAQDLMKKERRAIEATLTGTRRLQSYSLIFLLVCMITIAFLISGNIVRSIVRFEDYAQRIAAGDFTPITPARRYRDEFTDLGLAINQMMVDLQQHEAMLIQAHKMRAIGTLTAGVAHELNNPLNNITITAHMLLEDYGELEDDERIDMVKDVAHEAGRAKKIVSNLLAFTREGETRLEPLDLVEVVRDTISLASNQIKIAGINVELNAVDDPPSIEGDRQQLQQVLLNLLLNAVQASPRRSKVQILVHPADEPSCLAVKVVDYGSGIPAHIVPRIFDPFFTTKEQGKGTGLGLSVSRGIIAKHEGRLLVDSREGRGTTFTVILPARTEPQGGAAPADATAGKETGSGSGGEGDGEAPNSGG